MTIRAARILAIAISGSVAAFLVVVAPLAGKQQPAASSPRVVENQAAIKPGAGSSEPTALEANFADGSNLKVTWREERIELVTPYGKLSIPVADICRIDFGVHVDEATAKRLDAAIAVLGSGDGKAREAAAAELLDLGEHAFPALLKASKATDTEVAQRAEAILTKLREKIPPERLQRPTHDVIITADCKFTGRITADALKVKTTQFGDQQVKPGDLASLGLKGYFEQQLIYVQQFPQFGGQFGGQGGGFGGLGGFPGQGMGGVGGLGGLQPGIGGPGIQLVPIQQLVVPVQRRQLRGPGGLGPAGAPVPGVDQPAANPPGK
jgi:hypothetical protein